MGQGEQENVVEDKKNPGVDHDFQGVSTLSCFPLPT